jgi:hypothetical protein
MCSSLLRLHRLIAENSGKSARHVITTLPHSAKQRPMIPENDARGVVAGGAGDAAAGMRAGGRTNAISRRRGPVQASNQSWPLVTRNPHREILTSILGKRRLALDDLTAKINRPFDPQVELLRFGT